MVYLETEEGKKFDFKKRFHKNNQIKIIPNPVTENSVIVIDDSLRIDGLQIYDISGRKIFSKSKTADCIAWLWIRIEPPPNSVPFRTMS